MKILNGFLCLMIMSQAVLLFGFNTFQAKNFYFEKPSKHLSREQDLLKLDVDSMNTSVSDLTARVLELETSGGPHALVEKDAIKSAIENQRSLGQNVESLASSLKRVEEKIEADIKTQEETTNSIKSKKEDLESRIKIIRSRLPNADTSNLALHRPTKSSSLFRLGRTSGAVDGKLSTSIYSGSCFASDRSDERPWWQVDLESPTIIKVVNITARGDCCPTRLHDFAVEVFNEDPSYATDVEAQLCYTYRGRETKKSQTLSCKCKTPLNGRYVRITKLKKKNDQDKLEFCEVQIFG